MKSYGSYTVEDFVQDERFRTWVRRPTGEEDIFWEQWLALNPHMRPVMDEARAIVLSIHPVNPFNVGSDEMETEIQTILSRIDEEENTARGKSTRARAFWLKIAASIAVVLAGSWYVWQVYSEKQGTDSTMADNYMIEQVNRNDEPLLINLPDRSSILLSKNSSIRYARTFDGNTREVYLSGNAFFEVTKNPEKPFIVDAGQIKAKVLGTSFEINTAEDKETRIVVRSGSVSVYSMVTRKTISDAEPDIILGEDDELIVKGDAGNLQRTQLGDNAPADNWAPDTHLKFEWTPVSEVLEMLSRVYYIKIDYSAASIEGCTINASFTDEPFELKLALICRSIGLDYEIENNHAIVKGEGCKTY